MKTSDELWRWIWEDEDLLDPSTLGELVGPDEGADRPAGMEPPPAVTAEGVWEWVSSDEDLIDTAVFDLEAPQQPETPEPLPWETSEPLSGHSGVSSGDASTSMVYEWPPPPPPPPPPPAPSLSSARPVVEPQPVVEPPPVVEPEPLVEAEFAVESPTVVEPPPAVEPPLVVVEPPAVVEHEAVVQPEPEPEPKPVVPSRVAVALHPAIERQVTPEASTTARRAWLARIGAFVAVAAVVAVVAPRVLPAVVPGDADGGGPAGAPPDQNVVAWTVRLTEAPDATFVAILAAGVKPPVIMAVPADVTINVPGQGLGTVGEAAAGGDVGLVGVALENLVGVRMDGSVDSTSAELQAAVDALGTIEVADQPMAGEQVIQYLTALDPGALPDERFLRWQDVLEGIRDGVAANPDAVAGFPEPLRPVLAAGSPEPMALYGLPVVDLGAGLLRPDEQGLETLVKDLFVPHAGAEVRIVVLNGVGRPGVGEEVARILVPEGYRLMSTGNANTFGVKTTKIIALSEGDLAAAQRAQGLLGVGEVLMAEPTGLADVQIVVGEDFVNAHLGGA